MPPTLRRDGSFIVRIWWERRVGADSLWRGQVIHAQTGRVRFFDQVEDLLVFLEQCAGTLRMDKVEGESPLEEPSRDTDFPAPLLRRRRMARMQVLRRRRLWRIAFGGGRDSLPEPGRPDDD